MKKVFVFLVLVIFLESCGECNVKQNNTKSLSEIEFFYMEYMQRGVAIHADVDCTDSQCVYLKKSQVKEYGNFLCPKCISKELAREILEM